MERLTRNSQKTWFLQPFFIRERKLCPFCFSNMACWIQALVAPIRLHGALRGPLGNSRQGDLFITFFRSKSSWIIHPFWRRETYRRAVYKPEWLKDGKGRICSPILKIQVQLIVSFFHCAMWICGCWIMFHLTP